MRWRIFTACIARLFGISLATIRAMHHSSLFPCWSFSTKVRLVCILIIGLIMWESLSAATNPPAVVDRQEVVTEGHSTTYERIVPPALKPPR